MVAKAATTAGPISATAWRAARLARPRLADRQRAAHEGLLIESLDRLFRHRAVLKLDEGESTRTARVAINGKHDLGGRANLREMRAQIRLGCPLGHIADEQTYSHGH